MGYKTIRMAGFMSGILGAVFVLLGVAQTIGPWARPSGDSLSAMLGIGWLGFSTLSTVATSVVKILESQADQIAELQRQLAERQPAL